MKIILPVAGSGTRLRPLTHTTTKSLLRVGKRRMLGNVIDSLGQIAQKIDKLIFITDKNNDEQIRKYIHKHFSNFDAEYIIQHEKLGPGHAVWLAKPFINDDDDILIIFNDTLFVTDLTKIFKEYKNYDGLIYSYPTDDPKRFGIITYDIENGNITDMIEKPQHDVGSDLAIVGLYYIKHGLELMNKIEYTMRNEIKDGAGDKKEYFLTIPLKLMIKDGKIFKAPKLDDWLDCGKKETLLETNRKLLNGFKEDNDYSSRYPDCKIIQPVNIDRTTKVTNSIIGPNVSIGGCAEIKDCIIQNAIINPGAKLERAILKNSLVGENAEIIGNSCSIDLGDDGKVNLGS